MENLLLFERNSGRKSGKSKISNEIWSSGPEFWKVAILKIFGKFRKSCLWQSSPSNAVDIQPAILTQKGLQQKWP